jgi:hypothetical protein
MAGLDAEFLSVMGGEKWGARPIVHQAQVLKVPPGDRAAGWPPYVVAGVAMTQVEPHDAGSELGLIVRCVVEAVKQFNAENGNVVQTIGLGADWIGLRKLSPEEAADIIIRSFEKSIRGIPKSPH